MSPKTYIVGSTQELHTAAKNAVGGDIIKLKPGSYEGVKLYNLKYGSDVTITSSDPNNRAVFADKVTINDSTNIIFDNLEFEHVTIPETGANVGYYSLAYIVDSEGITISNSKMTGIVATETIGDPVINKADAIVAGHGVGVASYVRSSSDVTFQNNEFSDFYQGIQINDTENLTIARNYLHDLRSDGILGTDHRNTLIEENLFANLNPYMKDPENPDGTTDDHADFIQYWAKGADFGIDNFKIKNNVFIQEENTFVQTIFGRLNRPIGEETDVSLTNFEVSGNLIYGAGGHGITLSDVDGAKIFDNTLIASEDSLEDLATLPKIKLSYDGLYPWVNGFDINASNVQNLQNVDVYNNIQHRTSDTDIWIKSYHTKTTDLDEVKAAHDVRTWGNSWIDSKGLTADNFKQLTKIDVDWDEDRLQILLDQASEEIHAGAGSKYYYDTGSLETFLNNLNLDFETEVKTIDFVSGANNAIFNEPDSAVVAAVDAQAPANDEPETEVAAPEPVKPEPVVAAPTPEPVKQEPVVVVAPEPEPVRQEPVVVAPEPEPEPVVAAPEPVKPEPVVVAPEPEPVKQEPVVVTPEPEPVRQEPVVVAPEPEPEPVVAAPEPVKQEPVVVTPDPEPVKPEPVVVAPEPEQVVKAPAPAPIAMQNAPAADAPLDTDEDMMVVILNGATTEYDVYLQEDGTFSITDLATGIKDQVEEMDAIFFGGDRGFYKVDSASGETERLNIIENRSAYQKLLKIGTQMNAQDDMIETQIGKEEKAEGELLLANAGVDFVSGTNGKDIIMCDDSHAVILGGGNVDTLVMEGRAEHYIHHAKADGMHSLFSARTGEVTEFTDVEQIFFAESDQLHFVGGGSALPHMSKDSYTAEYARIENAIWTYEENTDGL